MTCERCGKVQIGKTPVYTETKAKIIQLLRDGGITDPCQLEEVAGLKHGTLDSDALPADKPFRLDSKYLSISVPVFCRTCRASINMLPCVACTMAGERRYCYSAARVKED